MNLPERVNHQGTKGTKKEKSGSDEQDSRDSLRKAILFILSTLLSWWLISEKYATRHQGHQAAALFALCLLGVPGAYVWLADPSTSKYSSSASATS